MRNRYTLLFVILGTLLFCAPAAFAQQGFNFQNFSSTAGLTLNGNAAQVGNVLRLTPATGSQAGSAWFNTQQVVSNGFTSTFQFRLTNPSNPPADGIAFVIQNSGLNALGSGGGNIGYTGITNSVAIEFDVYCNGYDLNDLCSSNDVSGANEVGVQSCGAAANTANHDSCNFGQIDLAQLFFLDGAMASTTMGSPTVTLTGTPYTAAQMRNMVGLSFVINGLNFGLITATNAVNQTLTLATAAPSTQAATANYAIEPVLADGNVHTVVINLDPLCECNNLTIYIDGNTPVLTAFFDITSLGLGGEGEDSAFVGFTGATGAAFENQDILNWSFTPHSGTTENQILTFNPGTNVSQTATFDCTSNTVPCTDPEANSLKLTVGQVAQTFSLVVSATKVSGNGNCASGDPNDANDFDCRFVNHFGTPGVFPAVTVPLCDPYDSGSCVYYRVENPPSASKLLGPVDWYIAWNDDSFVTGGGCAAVTSPTTYQCDNRQMAYDPSSPHPSNDPNQFTTYITTYFNDSGGQVGIDPGLGGKTPGFSDVVVVFPQTGPSLQLTLEPPLSGGGPISFKQGRTFPIKFGLKQGNILINNAATSPNTVGIAVLDSNNHPQPIVNPGDPPPAFVLHGNHYQYNLNTSFLAPGTYTVVISSNLFPEETITLVLTH